jgi:hypothetical protein
VSNVGEYGIGLWSGTDIAVSGNDINNPVGHVASPFTASNLIVDSGGSSSTPTNASTTTNSQSAKTIIKLISTSFTAGHTFVLKMDGTQIVCCS